EPSLKKTVPVGTPDPVGVTVAVKVIDCPNTAGLGPPMRRAVEVPVVGTSRSSRTSSVGRTRCSPRPGCFLLQPSNHRCQKERRMLGSSLMNLVPATRPTLRPLPIDRRCVLDLGTNPDRDMRLRIHAR